MFPGMPSATLIVEALNTGTGVIVMSTTPGRAVPEPMSPAAQTRAGCPAWCRGGHENEDGVTDLATGLLVRSHQGPYFGRYISTGAEETLGRLDVPTAIVFELDGVEMNAVELRCLADHAAAAAAWCEANRQLD